MTALLLCLYVVVGSFSAGLFWASFREAWSGWSGLLVALVLSSVWPVSVPLCIGVGLGMAAKK